MSAKTITCSLVLIGAFLVAVGWSAGEHLANVKAEDAQSTQTQDGVPQTQDGVPQPGDQPGQSQDEQPQIPQIADEPKTVDPATLVPEQLARPASVDFRDSSLREVADWLQQQGITTLLDTKALSEAGIPQGEPVSDRLDNEPIYLLLNRLTAVGLSWYTSDDILHITTDAVAGERMTTQSYAIGDLFDLGFEEADLDRAIMDATSPETWFEYGGAGTLEWLGDILFVHQHVQQQREVAGYLQALRQHARQTFTYDPPRHMAIRDMLATDITVDFQDEPLTTAIDRLATDSGVSIRLDPIGLREARIRDREPVTLSLQNQKLGTVLEVLISKLDMKWRLQDGVLWITSPERAESDVKTALYDVRDLCGDNSESRALERTILSQTEANHDPMWFDNGGVGTIGFPKTGVMSIRQTEALHQEVLRLLTMYRQALASSQPRDRGPGPRLEVLTRYYRMPTNIAADLRLALPQLIEPESWRTDDRRAATGTIRQLASAPDLLGANGYSVVEPEGTGGPNQAAVVVPHVVLVIEQTRQNHEEITTLLHRIREGDRPINQTRGGPMGGSGGFGGNYGIGAFKP